MSTANNTIYEKPIVGSYSLPLAGLLVGIVLVMVKNSWTGTVHDNALAYGIGFFSVSWGLFYIFCYSAKHTRTLLIISGTIALLLAISAIWVALQMPAANEHFKGDGFRMFTNIVATIIVVYICLPYLQFYLKHQHFRFNYTFLFNTSWNNTVIAIVSSLFTGLFWGLLMLWGGLFKLIGIDTFIMLFTSDWFYMLVLPVSYATGVMLLTSHTKVVNTLKQITLTIFRALMPVLAIMLVLFIVTLPFTGLQPLWDTKYTSSLLLVILLVSLLFFNAVYQDGDQNNILNTWARVALSSIIITMPILVVIIFVSISLRISQYGLTPSRIYVLIFSSVLFLYAIGYSANLIPVKGKILGWVSRVNIPLSGLVVVLALLLHTPLLDPLSLSANSQYSRYKNKIIKIEKFDFGFLYYKLGRMGNEKLDIIVKDKKHLQYKLAVETINKTIEKRYYVRPDILDRTLVMNDIVSQLSTITYSDTLFNILKQSLSQYELGKCLTPGQCYVFELDINEDKQNELILFTSTNKLKFFTKNNVGQWRLEGSLSPDKYGCCKKTKTAILKKDYKSIPPEYNNIVIGNTLYLAQPDKNSTTMD